MVENTILLDYFSAIHVLFSSIHLGNVTVHIPDVSQNLVNLDPQYTTPRMLNVVDKRLDGALFLFVFLDL